MDDEKKRKEESDALWDALEEYKTMIGAAALSTNELEMVWEIFVDKARKIFR